LSSHCLTDQIKEENTANTSKIYVLWVVLKDDALKLKHIATVNNIKILVVLTGFASFIAYFAVFFICDAFDKRSVIILYRKGGIYEMEL